MVKLWIAFLALASFLSIAANAASPAIPTIAKLPVVAPAIDCAKLADADITAAVGAKTHITSATPVADARPAPYCRVTGYVEPEVKFEVRLPLATWTERFVQTGCGGLCGNLNIRLGNADGCYPAAHGELALASTDMGHSGGMEGEFGRDARKRIDFAYRGVHVTTLAAKALIARFYGQPPQYSYFAGCSDGGREALMEAQRYPEDFDGITAGAPAMNFTTQNTFFHGWNARQNTGPDGKAILTADKLPLLHQAALQACDAGDGLKDGLISNPLSCRFDPAVVECKANQEQNTCLTNAQVEVARQIYAGAHDHQGNNLVLSGPLPGSELDWRGVYVPASADGRMMSPMISAGTLKYLAYSANPPADYSLKDLQFTAASFQQATRLHGLYDATDPDLAAFAKHGGKLILWHGLADPHISPLNTIAYYTAMNRIMGDAEVQKFARLYLFPGGSHCGGGEGPFDFDLMTAIMAWVEEGAAPFALLASHRQSGPNGPIAGVPSGPPPGAGPNGPPPAPAERASSSAPTTQPPQLDRTRPVFPYPLTAKYTGSGSIDDSANFTAGPAVPVSAEKLQWLGASFYTPGHQLWCQGDGASMTCKSGR